MRSCPAVRDQLVAHAARKRQIGDPVAVQMTQLAPPEPELDAAEAVRGSLDTRP